MLALTTERGFCVLVHTVLNALSCIFSKIDHREGLTCKRKRHAALPQTCAFPGALGSQLVRNLELLNAGQLWNNSFLLFL